MADHHDPADRLARREGHGTHLHLLVSTPSEAYDLATKLNARPGTAARVVRGAKCRTAAGLFDEFAAAWQFPPHFGANWDALDECLGDLDWLAAGAVVLVVTDADGLLADEPPAALGTFVAVIAGLAGGPDATLRAVLQVEPAGHSALAGRLTSAGGKADLL